MSYLIDMSPGRWATALAGQGVMRPSMRRLRRTAMRRAMRMEKTSTGDAERFLRERWAPPLLGICDASGVLLPPR